MKSQVAGVYWKGSLPESARGVSGSVWEGRIAQGEQKANRKTVVSEQRTKFSYRSAANVEQLSDLLKRAAGTK